MLGFPKILPEWMRFTESILKQHDVDIKRLIGRTPVPSATISSQQPGVSTETGGGGGGGGNGRMCVTSAEITKGSSGTVTPIGGGAGFTATNLFANVGAGIKVWVDTDVINGTNYIISGEC